MTSDSSTTAWVILPLLLAFGPAVALYAIHRWSARQGLRFWSVTLAVVWLAVVAGFMLFVGDVLIVRSSEGVATYENPDIWLRLNFSAVFLLAMAASYIGGIWLGAWGRRRAGGD